MSITIQRTHHLVIDQGIYSAVVQAVEEDEEGKFGPQVKLIFKVDEFDPEITLYAWASAKFNESSKLFKWTQAALGRLADDYNFNSDDLVGKRVQLNVIVKQTITGEANRVDDVLPMPRQTVTRSQAAKSATVFDNQQQPDQGIPPKPEGGPEPWEVGEL
jgi:hypothetical protein